ncbi:hypothetical protein V8G54_002760 [Vigna mungo]|uniref:Uncharacterized protein n=1 Tax=Vigna mungo TaxID=3915 RepID=A0AAQ3PAM2_VIGMU
MFLTLSSTFLRSRRCCRISWRRFNPLSPFLKELIQCFRNSLSASSTCSLSYTLSTSSSKPIFFFTKLIFSTELFCKCCKSNSSPLNSTSSASELIASKSGRSLLAFAPMIFLP